MLDENSGAMHLLFDSDTPQNDNAARELVRTGAMAVTVIGSRRQQVAYGATF